MSATPAGDRPPDDGILDPALTPDERRALLPPDRHYSPRRVLEGLRDLAAPVALPGGGRDSGLPRARRAEPWVAFEEPVCRRADIERALLALPWFDRLVAWHIHVRRQTVSQTVRLLAAVGEVTTRETVRAAADRAPVLMARHLGWRPAPGQPEAPPPRRARDIGRIRTWFAEALAAPDDPSGAGAS